MNEKQEKFIILRKIKYGESDLIIHALSSRGEKYSFMARGALKSKKRFGGGILDPLHYVTLTYKEHSDVMKMKSLTEAILIDDFKEVRHDYDRLELGLYILNAVSHVSQEGDTGSEFLFNLTGHSLRVLSHMQNLKLLKLHFCLKFLYQQGVMSIESWMSPFLKNRMADSASLAEDADALKSVNEYLDSIDLLVMQYIKTADAGFS